MLKRAIAIDFDGCLCENAWPEIGAPNWDVINAAKRERESGSALILWTCRRGRMLTDAVIVAACWGLTFDAINDNLPDRISEFGSNSRKICADEYWDDKAVRMPATGVPTTVNQIGGRSNINIKTMNGNMTINIK